MHVRWTLAILLLTATLSGCGPTAQYRAALADGFTHFTAHQYDASEKAAATYLQKFPDDPHTDEAYYLRGLSRLARSDRPGATADLHAALARTQRPDLKAKAYRALGDLARADLRFPDAVTNYKESLRYYPPDQPDAVLFYRLGAVLQAVGQWDEARPYLQRALADNSVDPEVRQGALAKLAASAFALQYGAFQDAAGANNMAKALQTLGVTPFVTSELREGHLWFLVRSGSYRTYDEAHTMRSRMLPRFPVVRIVP